ELRDAAHRRGVRLLLQPPAQPVLRGRPGVEGTGQGLRQAQGRGTGAGRALAGLEPRLRPRITADASRRAARAPHRAARRRPATTPATRAAGTSWAAGCRRTSPRTAPGARAWSCGRSSAGWPRTSTTTPNNRGRIAQGGAAPAPRRPPPAGYQTRSSGTWYFG